MMDLSLYLKVMLASALAGTFTTIGIYVINHFEYWGRQNMIHFKSFAAGVLLSVTFIHIISKSITMSQNAPIYFLIGFMGLHIFRSFLKIWDRNDDERPDYFKGLTPMLGIGFHSFIDGIIYAVTFNVSVFTGILTALGMVLHEFPEGIITFLLLEEGGFTKRKAARMAFLSAAISTPVGTLISFPIIHQISKEILGLLLALSAGALIYVGATHLLPSIVREKNRYSLLTLISGILIAGAILLTKGSNV